jgi:hypothetical protein
VLVVIALLTLAAYQYSELMMAEYRAADSYNRSAQARALAASGVHYTAALLSSPDSFTTVLNGNPYDNPGVFASVAVGTSDSSRAQGRFSVVAPLSPDDTGAQPYRFGVSDECGKINLNALLQLDSSGKVAHDMLLKLPGMTEEIANSILDWIDPDDEPRSNGAENSYYQGLSPAYRCKNGPLDSLEELLLVKGVTPLLLFGNDRNRNGTIDPDEDDGSGNLSLGWSAYLTIYSREQNVDAEGNPRIYINDTDLNSLQSKLDTALGSDLTTYILAYRLYGGTSNSGSRGGQGGRTGGGAGGSPSRGSFDMRRRARSIASLYELVNSSVSIPGPTPQSQPTVIPSPLNNPGTMKQLLPILLDKVTTSRDPELPARVNVNTAPRSVLAALPGLTDADVQSILDHRPAPGATDASDPIYRTPAWLLTEANFPPDTLRTLEKYVTARSQVYGVQVIGHFDGGGPMARVQAVIDTNNGRPRIVYWRDLTELGRGFDWSVPSPTN